MGESQNRVVSLGCLRGGWGGLEEWRLAVLAALYTPIGGGVAGIEPAGRRYLALPFPDLPVGGRGVPSAPLSLHKSYIAAELCAILLR